MYLDGNAFGKLGKWIRDEVDFPGDIANGARGLKARRVQEWLNLHGFGLAIDNDFGDITQGRVEKFQQKRKIAVTGVVDQATFAALTAPMRAALSPLKTAPTSIGAGIVAFAKSHLAQHPLEIGGQNMGPWVRMYMKGNQGNDWPWCAGFVSFVMHQASEQSGKPMPIEGSFSCDLLAAQAKEAGLFLAEAQTETTKPKAGAIFLSRRTSNDWTHTGIVARAGAAAVETIEGNTNDEGSREGYEVCARTRGYTSRDFITV